MTYSQLRSRVAAANVRIHAAGLVVLSFGNASEVERGTGVMAIKPSGIPYETLEAEDIVVVSLETGLVVAGSMRPSSDTPTHLVLYREFPDIGGIVHTHSPYATSWAQARRAIPCLGTTHADHFYGSVPVCRPLSSEEIAGEYERKTAEAITETINEAGNDPTAVPGVLAASHGPFTWGPDADEAVDNAIALEMIAAMALYTSLLEPSVPSLDSALLDRHFLRKHGREAYYGQTID
jgi:L-ribulose-5-phosphate 4-epimerase